MRLPNGYGSVVKMSGKRRKPYMVRKTIGWHAGVAPTIQKKIAGHSGAMSLTERVYTHLDIQTLIDGINMICPV